MKLIKLSPAFFQSVKDEELLHNHMGRPCVLVMKLSYKGKRMDFAAPLRSKISADTPKVQYFPLPPNSNTPAGKFHGIHFTKMHPIKRQYFQTYVIGNRPYDMILRDFLDAHEKAIVTQAQEYLIRYAEEGKPQFAVDIDSVIIQINIE